MKSLLIIQIFFETFLIVLALTDCRFSDLNQFRIQSILRGHYLDVASESNGAVITSARDIVFKGDQLNQSPLRNQIYLVGETYGHCYTYYEIQVKFVQLFEINQIIIWFYDIDIRTHYFKLIAEYQDLSQKVLYEDREISGMIKIKIPDQIISKLIVLNQPGGTYGDIPFIKIQAFYLKNHLT